MTDVQFSQLMTYLQFIHDAQLWSMGLTAVLVGLLIIALWFLGDNHD